MMQSTSGLLLLSVASGLLLIGAISLIGVRRGWMRNGYFGIPATILIVLGIFLAFQVLGGVLVIAIGAYKETGVLLLGANGVAQIAIMLLGTVFLSRKMRQDPFAVFRLEGFHETPAIAYILSIPIILSAQIAGESVSSLWVHAIQHVPAIYHALESFESQNDTQIEALVTAHGLVEFILILIFVAVVPAFAEETLFRGFAQTNIERSGRGRSRPFVALIIASLLFASIHVSVFKFPGLLALGLALGWMAYRTNNLFVGSLGHAANNGLIVIALYLKPDLASGAASASLTSTADMSTPDALSALAGSLPVLGILLYIFHRATQHIEARGNADREIEVLHAASVLSNHHDETSFYHDQTPEP